MPRRRVVNRVADHLASPWGGVADPIASARMLQASELVANAYMMPRGQGGGLLDPRRDVEDECGYPRLQDAVNPELYRQLWERDAVAARAIEVLPKECWQTQPKVTAALKAEDSSPFDESFKKMVKGLRGGGHFRGEEGNPFWEHLVRLDVLIGVGRYGVLFLGFDDGAPLDQPVQGISETGSFPLERETEPKNGKPFRFVNGDPGKNPPPWSIMANAEGGRKLQFLRAFDEHLAPVLSHETNPRSPRFGLPTMYQLTFNDPMERWFGAGFSVGARRVHWTRVVHACDHWHQPSSSEVYAIPRPRPILNNLLGLHKLHAADPEMYYRGAMPGHQFSSHPQLGGDVVVDREAMKDEYERWFNSLQRLIVSTGGRFESLAPQVSDPTPHVKAQIDAVCIKLGIPVRVFMGSERGELASSQDDAAWNDRLKQRQHGHVTPKIICPVIDRLILAGVLPVPEDGYAVEWPDLTSLSQDDRDNSLLRRTQALGAYADSGAHQVMAPMDWLTREYGLDQADAEAVLESAAEEQEESSIGLPSAQDQLDAETERKVAQLESDSAEKQPSKDKEEPGKDGGEEDAEAVFNQAKAALEALLDGDESVLNAFCPTGEGDGVDQSYSPGGINMNKRME